MANGKPINMGEYDGKALVPTKWYDVSVSTSISPANEYCAHTQVAVRALITTGPFRSRSASVFIDPAPERRDGETEEAHSQRVKTSGNLIQQLWKATHGDTMLTASFKTSDDLVKYVVESVQKKEARALIVLRAASYRTESGFYKTLEEVPEAEQRNARMIDEKNVIREFRTPTGAKGDARSVAKTGGKVKSL